MSNNILKVQRGSSLHVVSLTDVGVAVGVLVGVDVGVDVGVLVGVDVGVFIQEHSCNRQVSYQESNGKKESGLRRLCAMVTHRGRC